MDANDAKAVIDAKIQQPLGGRKILAVTQSKTDEVYKWLRTNDEYAVNDRTRDLFKKAVIDMFGGESKIPASVKKAMLMSDYNAGKPLTARRILAVKAAIDADGTAKARAAQIKLETFRSPEVRTAALGLGYMNSELPKLARAAHFYAQATGVSEMEAMQEVGRPGTNANRLMNYGGRFLQSAENFADGLRLIEMFSQWHDGLSAVHDNISGLPPTIATPGSSISRTASTSRRTEPVTPTFRTSGGRSRNSAAKSTRSRSGRSPSSSHRPERARCGTSRWRNTASRPTSTAR